MDRLEQELSRKHLTVLDASTQVTDDRVPSPSARSGSYPTEQSDYSSGEARPRPHFRLDPGHHQSRSRWLHSSRVGRSGLPRHLGDIPSLVSATGRSRNFRCSPVVASREAQVLSAMVNWISGPVEPLGRSSYDSVDRVARCLATVGGRNSSSRSGSVEFWPNRVPIADYYLTHSSTEMDAIELGDHCLIERYSLFPGADWWAGDLRGSAGCYRFRAYHQGVYCTEVQLQVPGTHQVLPALAAVAIGVRMDLSPREIRDRLEEFSGVHRGFESRGSYRGATLVDDEALGYQAVAEALKLTREVFGRRTLRAVFLPHDRLDCSESPTADEFVEANHLVLIEGASSQGESTRLLAASLRSSGTSVVLCSSLDRAIRELDRDLEPGDVLVTLGAGEVGTIADAFLRRLSRDRHG